MNLRAIVVLLTLFAAAACSEPLEFADWTIPVPEGTRVIEYAPVGMEERGPEAIRLVEDLVIGTDLSDPDALADVGLSLQSLGDMDWSRCQVVGGATEWLGRDGLLIPSARAKGTNLVIFPNRKKSELRVVASEVINE